MQMYKEEFGMMCVCVCYYYQRLSTPTMDRLWL